MAGSVIPVAGTAAGAVAGAIGGGIYGGIRGQEGVYGDIEGIYQTTVGKPLRTGFTAAQMARSGAGFNFDEAGEMSKGRSPGQALALLANNVNILNKAELAAFAGTDEYEMMSGTFDTLSRIFLDPTVVAGRAAKVARASSLVKEIHTVRDIDNAVTGARWNRFDRAIDNIKASSNSDYEAAGKIRDRFFHNDRHGPVISTILAEAPDSETRVLAARALMGDINALEPIKQRSHAIAGQIQRTLGQMSEKIPKEQRVTLLDEVNDLYDEAERLGRMDAYVGGMMRTAPRASTAGAIRTNVIRTDFYQHSNLAAPLRTVFNMKPSRLVNLHDQSGDVQLARMLRKSELEPRVQDEFRGRYMAATNEVDRQNILTQAEAHSVRSIAEKAGMTEEEIGSVMNAAAKNRAQAATVLKGRVFDGEGRSRMMLDGEDGVMTEVPLWVSQNANVLPIVDLDAVRNAASKIGQFRQRFPSTDLPAEMMDRFYKIWKPSVLLRFGWPLRVVGEEQLRIMSKIGAMSYLHTQGSNIGRHVMDWIDGVPKEQRGFRTQKVMNYEMEDAFGVPGHSDNIYKSLTSSRASFENLAAQTEAKTMGRLREATGEWRSIAPDHPDYARAWERDVNLQIGQDAMARRLLEGDTPEQVARWLKSDPEGIAYGRRNKIRHKNPDRWVSDAAAQLDSYLPTQNLKELALAGKARADDLVREMPDPTGRPIVHGEILAQSLGKGVFDQTLNNIVQKGYETLGQRPTDFLSRQPFFSYMYRAESERLVKLLDDQKALTPDDLRKVEKQSREFALGETKNLLFDLAEESDLAGMLKFFSPFYMAWQEVITRWAGIAGSNPAFVAQIRQAWQAPERMGLIQDQDGNRVGENGQLYADDGTLVGRVDKDTEKYVTVLLPSWARDIPGLRTQGQVKFNKESLNMALQGTPGFGPPVQIAVNEIVKERPDLEESMKFILPFGTTQDTKELVFPSAMKRLQSRFGGEDNRIFFNTQMRIYFDKVVDYNLGKREDKPTWAEANREAKAFFNLRTFAAYVSPAALSFNSPYQAYINAYRTLREIDPETADERFIEEYGPEYFPLTQSLSKSMDGIPPTITGQQARQKYKDLIEKYPDLGGLIVGSDGAGEFSRSVYNAQLSNKLKPGSNLKQREVPDFEEASQGPETRLGWMQFSKYMDLIEAERVQRGLPNLQVKEANDLAAMKRVVIERLKAKYPSWAEDYSVQDKGKQERKIKGLREIAADDRLAGRPEISQLRKYLKYRDAMERELRKRARAGGAKTLDASDNQDLALIWDTIKSKLVEENLAFGSLYYRYLERDRPELRLSVAESLAIDASKPRKSRRRKPGSVRNPVSTSADFES